MNLENGHLPPLVECLFCRTVAVFESALDQGWIPSFWHHDIEFSKKDSGICPACAGAHLKFNEEYGDYELLPDHPLPEE